MDLRELQKNYLDNLRKVTEEKLEIGSLVRTVISIEEGLVFKDGRRVFWNFDLPRSPRNL